MSTTPSAIGRVAVDDPAMEAAIDRCVRLFYARANVDPQLGPIMLGAIHDLEAHIVVIRDFWSHVLLRTGRYEGRPFPPHMALAIEPEHFGRWLELFEGAARETLPTAAADFVMEKARHMAESFMAGMFPFRTKDGRPSRLPPGA